MTRMRTSGLGHVLPLLSFFDLANRYAAVIRTAWTTGAKDHREQDRTPASARDISLDSISDGWRSFFFLYPVMLVHIQRQ